MNWLMRRAPENMLLLPELGWRPGGDQYIEPDFSSAPSGRTFQRFHPVTVLLIIEVAKTSLDYDTGLKARTYAALGVREYWVVNAVTLETTVYSGSDRRRLPQQRHRCRRRDVDAASGPGSRCRLAELGTWLAEQRRPSVLADRGASL